MARQLEWRSITAGDECQLTDHVAMLGPIRAFTLAQACEKSPLQKWEMTSHFIPSKQRRRVFTNVDLAKAECQKIVDLFARWIGAV